MQSNNLLRPFSTNTQNIYSDAELGTLSVIETGAPGNAGAVADSKLYNSLSATTTLACTALIDFVASQNPAVNFGQTLAIDNWIAAVNNSFVSLSAYNTAITNITNGTTVVGKATNATNATNAILNSNGSYSGFTANSSGGIRVGANIIPQYIYRFSTPTALTTDELTLYSGNLVGRIFEVEAHYSYNAAPHFFLKFRVDSYDFAYITPLPVYWETHNLMVSSTTTPTLSVIPGLWAQIGISASQITAKVRESNWNVIIDSLKEIIE